MHYIFGVVHVGLKFYFNSTIHPITPPTYLTHFNIFLYFLRIVLVIISEVQKQWLIPSVVIKIQTLVMFVMNNVLVGLKCLLCNILDTCGAFLETIIASYVSSFVVCNAIFHWQLPKLLPG